MTLSGQMGVNMNWKANIYNTAKDIASKYKQIDGVKGVAIGGSIARGTVWKHSDLELCLLVDNKIEGLDYFQVINGLGVEIIQIEESQMQGFINEYHNSGDILGALQFPLPIYQCRIIHDPQGIIKRFKEIYDKVLFTEQIKKLKQGQAEGSADERFEIAVKLTKQGNYNSALGQLRLAVNELLLAYYWHYSILPRSQNRTVYLLKKQSDKIGSDALYRTFTDIFGVSGTKNQMKANLLLAKADILNIVRSSWGDTAPEFLERACDGQLEWGYETSIVYVYKWCVHILQSTSMEEGLYDKPEFAIDHTALHTFLGFNELTEEKIYSMLNHYENVRSEL